MEQTMLAITEPMLMISLMTIGVLIFISILRSLRESSFFASKTTVVIAVCITILCIVGMHEFLIAPWSQPEHKGVSPGHSGDENKEPVIALYLLPYAALAVTILLLLIVLSIKRIIRRTRQRHLDKDVERYTEYVRNNKQTQDERRFK